jgi:hypothetical protein
MSANDPKRTFPSPLLRQGSWIKGKNCRRNRSSERPVKAIRRDLVRAGEQSLKAQVVAVRRRYSPPNRSRLKVAWRHPLRPNGLPGTSSIRHGLTECNGPPHSAQRRRAESCAMVRPSGEATCLVSAASCGIEGRSRWRCSRFHLGVPPSKLKLSKSPALVVPSNRYLEGAYFLLLRLAFSTSDESLSACLHYLYALKGRL